MKRVSKELHKSYIILILLFFLSYIGLFYFFISYIVKDTTYDIQGINSFIEYETGEFEKKLKIGKNLDELIYGALDECPKMLDTSVVFIHEDKIYSNNYSKETVEKLRYNEFSDEVQQKKFYYAKLENKKLKISFAKFILFNLPDFQFINKKLEIEGQSLIQIMIIKKLSHEKRMMLRLFKTSLIVILFSLGIGIYITKKFYREFSISLKNLQETTNEINLTNISNKITRENTFLEFDNITYSYNKMLERLKNQAQAQIDFVNNASHELKTPIFVISGYVNMIKRWGFEKKEIVEEGLTAIGEESKNMSNLVSKLLFLAKDKNELEKTKFDIEDILIKVVNELKIIYPNQKIELSTFHKNIVSEKFLIKQLITNILENAIKYGRKNEINIKMSLDKNLKLEIEDKGEGISEENLKHIYDKFFRVDKSRSRKIGSHGLGLSIVKKIVEILEIDMRVQSKINVGTKVTLIIPLNE